jgi:hypothetical protein
MMAVTAIWAAFGPLVGVLVGAYIANRDQRRQWVGNCKKEEYRELISVLTKARSTYLQVHHFTPAAGPDQVQALADETFRVAETTGDLIFIAPVVKRLNVLERWYAATTVFEGGVRPMCSRVPWQRCWTKSVIQLSRTLAYRAVRASPS